MKRTLKIAALQKQMGVELSPDIFDDLRSQGVEVACLPEYFFVPPSAERLIETVSLRSEILENLKEYSRRLGAVLVGGTLVEEEGERFYNACHVLDAGRPLGVYRKMHLTKPEHEAGLTPGEGSQVLRVRDFNLGLLICADVLYLESFRQIAPLQPDLIAIPTDSPFRADDTEERKFARDQDIFVTGARIAKAVVLKTCGVGGLLGHPLQGRSLICSPEGVLIRVEPSDERQERILIARITFAQV
jgi:deaminated glutathione amidase